MELWYSPWFILETADSVLMRCADAGITPPAELGKVIGECRTAALFCFSLGQRIAREVWLRPVDPARQAPDVEALYFGPATPKRGNRASHLEIEVASYTRYSNEELGAFIRRTKLNPRRAYSSSTILVFDVKRGLGNETDRTIRGAHDALASEDVQGLAFLVGRTAEEDYQVVQVYPRLAGPLNVSISDVFASRQEGVAQVKRGLSIMQSRSENPIPTENPFMRYLRE